jgi:transposase
MAPGAIASHVVRRFGVSSGQFYTWRKAMLSRAAACDGKSELAKAEFAEVRLLAPAPKPAPALAISPTGVMEIALPGDALIRVDAAVDGTALGCVLAVLARR